MYDKIIKYNQLSKFIRQLKQQPTALVLAGGCFDILHLGHIRFLKAAQKYGTLLVALESDANLKKFKGVNRPIHNQKQRAEVLSELQSVNYIILLPEMKTDAHYEKFTKFIKPQFIAVTAGDPHLKNKTAQANAVGAQIVVIPKIRTPSTSQLIKLLNLEKV